MSFTICVLGGVLVPGHPIRHQRLELLLLGFTWISLGSFVLGLAESLLYGVYAAAVLVVVPNVLSSAMGGNSLDDWACYL